MLFLIYDLKESECVFSKVKHKLREERGKRESKK